MSAHDGDPAYTRQAPLLQKGKKWIKEGSLRTQSSAHFPSPQAAPVPVTMASEGSSVVLGMAALRVPSSYSRHAAFP